MDCRDFHRKHLAYVDDTLPGIELVEVQRHLRACDCCARHDASVRRALMLLRNMPQIEPSADFTQRLNARLRALQPLDHTASLHRGPSFATFVTAAAGVAAIGFLALSAYDRASTPARDLMLSPVVASIPAPEPSPIASPAIVASVPTGFPLWQAVFLAEQAPMHLMRAEFREVSLER